MVLSRKAWIAAGLGARLLMVAFLAMAVQLTMANHSRLSYEDDYNRLQSYTYMVAVAVIGVAAGVLQLPVALYFICKSKRVATPSSSALIFDISLCADVVVSVLLASGVGAGFGATDDVLRYVRHMKWPKDDEGKTKQDLIDYYNKATVPVVFLLAGMVLSMAATVVSARLWARPTNDDDDA